MDITDKEPDIIDTSVPVHAILVKVLKGEAREDEKRFTGCFLVGRSSECDFQVLETCVSRNHLQIEFDGEYWRLIDLDSSNGVYVNGARIREVQLLDSATIELGSGGAVLSLSVEGAVITKTGDEKSTAKEPSSETQIISHYFAKTPDENMGEQTLMFRRAFERVQKKKSRKYQAIIGAALMVLLVAGVLLIHQTHKINDLKKTAETIFYSTKSLELQIARLEELVELNSDPAQIAELRVKLAKLNDMEVQYDNFVNELGIYKKLPEDERTILRVARIFGECDVKAPRGFVDEVRRYIGIWKKTDRLKTALDRANRKGYLRLITRVLKDNNLPPQYIFLALQESNFDDRAVGRETSFGFAKGMWQFIPLTANRYGLRTGPFRDQGVYDPFDERFDFVKSTVAATRYIKDISSSQAQASGLLVMASYNWGESNIQQIIRKMPENPKDRNFWRLLEHKNIPRETYDYVFFIVSAAVICENPRLFGVDAECPVFDNSRNAGTNM